MIWFPIIATLICAVIALAKLPFYPEGCSVAPPLASEIAGWWLRLAVFMTPAILCWWQWCAA